MLPETIKLVLNEKKLCNGLIFGQNEDIYDTISYSKHEKNLKKYISLESS